MKKHDETIARKVSLVPGSIVAMDRAYNDYKLFALWTENQLIQQSGCFSYKAW